MVQRALRIFCGTLVAGVLLLSPLHVFGAIDTGLSKTAEGATINTTVKIEQYTGIVIKALFSILGVIFLGIVIYAGLVWILSQGKNEEITRAREMIIWAVVGLAIVLAAYALTDFVVGKLADQTLVK
jgi:cbb3-type cytochrome oxidase subunit 3